MYYSATLFKIVGFNNATAVAITVSATNFVFSWVNLVIVDKFGRRMILLVTVLSMSICLVIAAIAFSYIPINLHTLEVESDEIGWPGMLLIVVIIIFVACYSSGVATIAWICKSHISRDTSTIANLRRHGIDSPRSESGWHNAEHCNMLVDQYHHRIDLPLHDEGNHPLWCIRILRRHLLYRMVVHHLLLPRGQGYAA